MKYGDTKYLEATGDARADLQEQECGDRYLSAWDKRIRQALLAAQAKIDEQQREIERQHGTAGKTGQYCAAGAEGSPSASLSRQLDMTTDDWIEVCEEVDQLRARIFTLEAQLAGARLAMHDAEGVLAYRDPGDPVPPLIGSHMRALSILKKALTALDSAKAGG